MWIFSFNWICKCNQWFILPYMHNSFISNEINENQKWKILQIFWFSFTSLHTVHNLITLFFSFSLSLAYTQWPAPASARKRDLTIVLSHIFMSFMFSCVTIKFITMYLFECYESIRYIFLYVIKHHFIWSSSLSLCVSRRKEK